MLDVIRHVGDLFLIEPDHYLPCGTVFLQKYVLKCRRSPEILDFGYIKGLSTAALVSRNSSSSAFFRNTAGDLISSKNQNTKSEVIKIL